MLEKERRNDLEKAILVLRRVVEKLQAENKRLCNSKMSQIQDVVKYTQIYTVYVTCYGFNYFRDF